MRKLLLLLTVGCLTACNLDVPVAPNDPSDPATETFDPSLGVDLASMTKTPDGVYYKDLIVGTGGVLTGQPYILYRLTGYVTSGAAFESGIEDDFPTPLSQFVPGLEEGMQGMRIGGQRLVVVPSALGFGNLPGGPVPPNSTLIFRVQLDDLP